MKEQVIDVLLSKAMSAIDTQITQTVHQYLEDSLNFYLQDSDVEKLSKIFDNYEVVCKPCPIVENSDGSITINIHPLDFILKPSKEQLENAN